MNDSGPIRLAALLPQSELSSLVRRRRTTLFSQGCRGAHVFPIAAPLALLSRPLEFCELKKAALSIRNDAICEGSGAKIHLERADFVNLAPFDAKNTAENKRDILIFGPALRINEAFLPSSAVISRFSKVILCEFLAIDGFSPAEDSAALFEGRSFSTWAIANIAFRALTADFLGGNGSFEWKIGRPAWLPRIKKQKDKTRRRVPEGAQ